MAGSSSLRCGVSLITGFNGLGDGFNQTGSVSRGDRISRPDIGNRDDKYTVIFKWKTANHESIMETLHGVMQGVWRTQKQSGTGEMSVIGHHAIGTGPFILKDFVSDIRRPDQNPGLLGI